MSRVYYVTVNMTPPLPGNLPGVFKIEAQRFEIENDAYVFYTSNGSSRPVASFKRSTVVHVLTEDLYKSQLGVEVDDSQGVSQDTMGDVYAKRPTEESVKILESRKKSFKPKKSLKDSLLSLLEMHSDTIRGFGTILHMDKIPKSGIRNLYSSMISDLITENFNLKKVSESHLQIGYIADPIEMENAVNSGKNYNVPNVELYIQDIQVPATEVFTLVKTLVSIILNSDGYTLLVIDDVYIDNVNGVMHYGIKYMLFSLIKDPNMELTESEYSDTKINMHTFDDGDNYWLSECHWRHIPVIKYEII